MATWKFGGVNGAMEGASAGSIGGPWGMLGGAIAGFTGLHGFINDSLGISPKEYDPEEDLKKQAQAIEMSQYGYNSPYGNVDWSGSIMDGTRKMNVTLSPFEQAKYDSAYAMLPNLTDEYGDAAAKRAEDAVYDTFLRKSQPQWNQDISDLQTRLANQGIAVGSDAYKKAMTNLSNTQYDAQLNAQNQAVLTGSSTRATELSNALNLFSSLQDINNPASSYMPQIGGSLSSPYATQMQYQNAQSASNASNMAGLASIIAQLLAKKGSATTNASSNGSLPASLSVQGYSFGANPYGNLYGNNGSLPASLSAQGNPYGNNSSWLNY
jgi:hypothetical protein